MSALDTYLAQSDALADWLNDLQPDDFARSSVLPGWDVRFLVAHLVMSRLGAARVLGTRSDAAALPLAEYVRAYRRDAVDIDAVTAEVAADRTPAELLDLLRVPFGADPVPDRTVLTAPRGPLTARDWITSRIIEVVVHADDLTRSLPDRDPAPITRPAMAATVRTLATILTTRSPGRSVEIRIPPYIAVQAIQGPRHTRGTPPNVIETDATTWIRVATGRETFADAIDAGVIRASGNRADLTNHVPLF